MPASTPSIIAHRGDSGAAPENTLAAFRAAIAAGADGVEFDVQLSADGLPVVIHDARLERTTSGSGWVGEHSAAALGKLEAGAWFAPPVRGEGVPTLANLLALLAPTALVAHVEIKLHGRDSGARHELVAAVLSALETAKMAGRAVLSSFDHHALREARHFAPHIPCAALLAERLLEPWHYAQRHGFQGLHPFAGMVDAELVQGCHTAGLALRPYTVDEPDEARRLLALGVDGIITNQPTRLLALREEGRRA